MVCTYAHYYVADIDHNKSPFESGSADGGLKAFLWVPWPFSRKLFGQVENLAWKHLCLCPWRNNILDHHQDCWWLESISVLLYYPANTSNVVFNKLLISADISSNVPLECYCLYVNIVESPPSTIFYISELKILFDHELLRGSWAEKGFILMGSWSKLAQTYVSRFRLSPSKRLYLAECRRTRIFICCV